MPKLTHARAVRVAYSVRVGRKVSAAEVARRIGCDRSYLCEVERGHRNLGDELTAILANLYGVEVADLTGENDPKPTTPPKQPTRPAGPPRRERSDTKSPSRAVPEARAS